MHKLFVIKIGGNVIDDEQLFSSFVQQFASITENKILVHGGGKIATSIGNKLGIESKYHNGRRITDAATLELATMVYGGLVNKRIVAALQAAGCNAMGLTGADGNILTASKREIKEIDFGWVGDTDETQVNINLLNTLLKQGITPVLAPLTHDGKGKMLNTNADTVASVIATALSALYDVKLLFCFDKKGVLYDAGNENDVVPEITAASFLQLKKENRLHSGILPKIENALSAKNKGVAEVIIGNAEDVLINTTNTINGTRII